MRPWVQPFRPGNGADARIRRNPLVSLDPPRVPKKEMKTLSGDQAGHLLSVARDDPRFVRYEAVYALTKADG